MKVLVVGSGGREHALVWKLSQSEQIEKIYCAPGSEGIKELAECVPIPVEEHKDLADFADQNNIDLTVIGPEDPLVAGIVDRFQRRGLRVFGPTQRAARLEGSKDYAKTLCLKNSIPAARSRTFRDLQIALQHLAGQSTKCVVKADGLAAGKGVTICQDGADAQQAVRKLMREGQFGQAGSTVVVEEFLEGQEVSILAISDGNTIVPFELAQDHKPIGDGDTGPMTGGMGTYSPLPQIKQDVIDEIEHDVVIQTIHAMNREEEPFKGCLFCGLMVTEDGPKVLEFNVRFGDPEIQTLVRRLKSDLFPLLYHAAEGTLDQCEIEWDSRPACSIILASDGYPERKSESVRIHGLNQDFGDDIVIFHAGTRKQDGQWYTGGGRVLAISAIADTLEDALEKAYAAADKIEFKGKQLRRDIGWRALKS